METAKNVLGTALIACSTDPLTGFYRDGCCHTGTEDLGTHVVCARLTDDFLQFSRKQGNDLITPMPIYNFPGLKAGDFWCLCVSRWLEAYKAGVAPPLRLEACHERSLAFVSLGVLKEHAL